jgi:1,5-anhydro-D-fructose reductase (1,5-anhydro-D-mannitol-forming)
MNQINWGIIGCGNVCEVKSGPAFQLVENSSLVAVMRRDESKVKDFATRHHVEKWYTIVDEIIQDKDVNAIYIATPPNTHAEYAIKAMLARKPVYVEKPMAIDHAQCLKMIETSKETGVKLMVAYYRRAFPYFLKIKEIIESQQIGTILTINLTTILPPRPEDYNQSQMPWHLIPEISGGSYFFDLACHQLDILDFLSGAIKDVRGWYTNRANIYEVEDTLVANLKFETGALASCSWSYAGNQANETDRIEIFGTKGQIIFSISTDSPIVVKKSSGTEEFRFEKPKHVEMPMIEKVVGSLLGKKEFESNMESAAKTAWVMDKIMGRI